MILFHFPLNDFGLHFASVKRALHSIPSARFSRALSFAFAFLLGSGASAHGVLDQPVEPGSVALDRVEIATARAKSLIVPSVEDARAEAGRVPGGTEVIDAQRFERGRAATVNDVFAFSSGVIAQSRFGSDEARLSIRGSGLQRTFHGRGLRILQDGVPLNLADGSFDFQAIEPLSAEYVTVWRGANALATGASTLGGAIDFVSRTAAQGSTPRVRAEAGSFGYARAQAAGGAVAGPFDGYVSLTHTAQDGYRRHAHQRNTRVFGNAGYRWSESAETRLYLTGVRTMSELPGNLLKSELKSDPRGADPVSAQQNRKRDFDLLRAAAKTTVRTGQTLWDFTSAWTYKDLDHPISPVVDQLTNDFMLGLGLTHQGELGAHSHRLKAGVMLNRGWINAANYVNVSGTRGALLSLARNTATNWEAYAEDQFYLEHSVVLVLGANAAENRRINQQIFGGTPSYGRAYRHFSPKIGLRWDLPEVQLYGNVSGSYEPPSFSETGAVVAPNRAQTATTWELGSRGGRRSARWDFSAYVAHLRNEFLSLNDSAGNPLGTINASRTMHAGAELAGQIDLLAWPRGAEVLYCDQQRLVLRGAWTWSRFRFDGDPVYRNNRLAGFPPHLIHGELVWENERGWQAGPTVEWSPARATVDHANTLFADPYAIVGLKIGRRRQGGLSWFLEVRNLFDRAYAATTGVIADAAGLDQRQFLPGDGRGYYGGVTYRW